MEGLALIAACIILGASYALGSIGAAVVYALIVGEQIGRK